MKIRLQRFMADCGVASRRECEAMIAGGRVRVNGEVLTKMPVMVESETDVITVDEEEIGLKGEGGGGEGLKEQKKVYFLLNKPKGINKNSILGRLLINFGGDAARMAKDVEAALHAVAMNCGGLTKDNADQWLQTARQQKRYLRDVY